MSDDDVGGENPVLADGLVAEGEVSVRPLLSVLLLDERADDRLQVRHHRFGGHLAAVEPNAQRTLADARSTGAVCVGEECVHRSGRIVVHVDEQVGTEVDANCRPRRVRVARLQGDSRSLRATQREEPVLLGDLGDRGLEGPEDLRLAGDAADEADVDLVAPDGAAVDAVDLHDQRAQWRDGLLVLLLVPLATHRVDPGDGCVGAEDDHGQVHDYNLSRPHPSSP